MAESTVSDTLANALAKIKAMQTPTITFCPDCGSRLVPQVRSNADSTLSGLFCPKCNFVYEPKISTTKVE